MQISTSVVKVIRFSLIFITLLSLHHINSSPFNRHSCIPHSQRHKGSNSSVVPRLDPHFRPPNSENQSQRHLDPEPHPKSDIQKSPSSAYKGTDKNLVQQINSTAPAIANRSSSNSIALSPVYKGSGTTWGGNWKGGNCGFSSWTPPSGVPEVAIPGNLWNNAGLCGACVEVTGPTGLKKVAIAGDSCFSCSNDGLDMDPEMWNAVTGNAPQGIVPITWKVVPCGFDEPLKIINKAGVSKDFLSLQVAGSNQPVKSLEISTDGGQSWTSATRQSSDNYFQVDQAPKNVNDIAVRVTCSTNKKVVSDKVDYTIPNAIASSSNNC